MMKVISLGVGVQSTAMYLMSSIGRIDRADHAVFADPGAESPKTYEILQYLQDWAKSNDGIPIHVNSEKNLYKDLLKGTNSTGQQFAGIPAFTENNGMLRRQCTSEYKIKPVVQSIRKLHGLLPRKRMPMTQVWLGISLDEIERMKISQLPRIDYVYPLIEKRMSRSDCIKFFKEIDFPVPPKSSCVFCPYYDSKGWKNMKANDSKSFQKAINVDKALRHGRIKEKIFLHRSLTALEDVEFADQQELFMCEEGFCGL